MQRQPAPEGGALVAGFGKPGQTPPSSGGKHGILADVLPVRLLHDGLARPVPLWQKEPAL